MCTVSRALGIDVSDGDNNDNIRHPTVGDEDFASVEDPVVTVLLRSRADTL